ncbi:hypothetical protein Poli38472_010996 [Pythium oligandrum]|uniref:Transmembrane protein n=1 Tax=Pythium oligandrum TaxID=41045 RepID=A0A8K1FKQ0_PYTOL|nr:hypothetical protein Poli38472_010996 [Pythium oligandrum]|eukprot:TMW61933.1 hypothetical protein Poli38472_010996 [Pythium oligandrum]
MRWWMALTTALVLLDARDLWFKTQWLSVDGGDGFVSTSTHTLASEAPEMLSPSTVNVTTGTRLQRSSGWTSFLDKCESVQPMQVHGSTSVSPFLHARLSNCHSGSGQSDGSILLPEILVSSSVRADSMAWTACQLLHFNRRPPICHETLVLDFRRRFGGQLRPMSSPTANLPRAWLAEPMSEAEDELLLLLDVLSKSAPMAAVVCVEGFASSAFDDPSAPFTPSLFGCASPTVFLSAIVGVHATGFAALHRQFAWLTIHDLDILDLHITLRRHAESAFRVTKDPRSSTLTLTHESHMRVNVSGALFHVLVAVDWALLLLHARSAIELVWLVVHTGDKPTSSSTASLFLTSLYRSPSVIALTTASRLLSWLLVIHIATVWTHCDDFWTQLHASLSILRVWPLVLFALRGLWNLFVFASEARAYSTLQHTHVSPMELILVTASTVWILLRALIIHIDNEVLTVDQPYWRDATVFPEQLAVSNGFYDDQDGLPVASTGPLLTVLYTPLVWVLVVALLLTTLLLIARYAYYRRQDSQASTQKQVDGALPTTLPPLYPATYARLPSEELLNTPIRAKQLVRSTRTLECTMFSSSRTGIKFLSSTQYLEHGVWLKDGQYLRTRTGFRDLVQPKIHVDDHHALVGHDLATHDTSDSPDSPAKRRRMSTHVPKLG